MEKKSENALAELADKELSVGVHRTAGFAIGRAKEPKLVAACEALMRAARSLENSTTFLLRNFKSAFEGGSLKTELHENEKACVKAMDEAVGVFLARKKPELEGKLRKAQEAVQALGKTSRKKAKDVEKAKEELVKLESKIASLPRRLGDRPGDKGAFGPGLASNISIVDIAYRKLTHLKADGGRGHALQKALPAAMATGCREAVQERFKAHGEAVKKMACQRVPIHGQAPDARLPWPWGARIASDTGRGTPLNAPLDRGQALVPGRGLLHALAGGGHRSLEFDRRKGDCRKAPDAALQRGPEAPGRTARLLAFHP